MHKKGNAVIGVIVLVVLLVAGGAFIYSQQSGSSDDPSQATSSPTATAEDNFYSTSTNNNATATENAAGTDSQQSDTSQGTETSGADQEVAAWKAAINEDGSVRCSLDTQMGPAESSTIYVSSGRARLESTFPDKPNSIIFVNKSGDSYMWKEGSETGRKSEYNRLRQTLNVFVDNENQRTLSKQHPVAEEKELKSIEDVIATSIVECEQSSVDESIFEKPQGVNFSG
jgi:uncharacterized protein (UPF0333 family)